MIFDKKKLEKIKILKKIEKNRINYHFPKIKKEKLRQI